MTMLFHYLPYILAAGLAALVLVCFFDGGDVKKTRPERPKRAYYRWDDSSARRD